MAEVGGGGFLGALGIIAGALVSFVRAFVGITSAALLRFVTLLKEYVVELAKQAVAGLFRLGKALARAVRALGVLALHGLRTFVTWAYARIQQLQAWLKDKFGPVLRFIRRIKDEIDQIYKRFVRPILDTIEFIRQINRVLQLFGIDVLQKLDTTLAQIEARIEEPFQWVRKKITFLENWLDRIVTLDGFFQRLTLLRSLQRYAPAWINHFWARQFDPTLRRGTDYDRGRDYPTHAVLDDVNALTDYWARGEGDRAARIDELRANFILALQTQPDRPPS